MKVHVSKKVVVGHSVWLETKTDAEFLPDMIFQSIKDNFLSDLMFWFLFKASTTLSYLPPSKKDARPLKLTTLYLYLSLGLPHSWETCPHRALSDGIQVNVLVRLTATVVQCRHARFNWWKVSKVQRSLL